MKFILVLSLIFLMSSPANAQSASGGNMPLENTMPEDRFWSLIDTSVVPAQQLQLDLLKEGLRTLSVTELEAFQRTFNMMQKRSYSWDLWGAAYVMNGGASDDGFEYFQRWLISKGRKVFESAVANPDSLANTYQPGEDYEFEEFAYVASDVWKEKTGIDPYTDKEGRFPYTGGPPADQPSGQPFKEDEDHLSKRYPKLWARSQG